MKDIMLTGARPTGALHWGHYISVFKNLSKLQNDFDTFFVVSDIHFLTTKITPDQIKKIKPNTIKMILDLIAIGMDPINTTFYLQSKAPAHGNIYYLIQNFIDAQALYNPSIIEMEKHSNTKPSLGLLAYSVLESADILGIGAKKVPVGFDNIEHVNIANKIIYKINTTFGSDIQKPEAIISTETTKLVGTDGYEKMSKSLGNAINIGDSSDILAKKIKAMEWNDDEDHNALLEYAKLFDIGEYYMFREKGRDAIKNIKDFLIENFSKENAKFESRVAPFKEDENLIIELLKKGSEIAAQKYLKMFNNLKDILGMWDF